MTVRRGGVIVAVGLLLGVLTQLGQGLLPDGVSQLANAISPWLTVAFLLGATMPDVRSAAVAGIAALALALVGYYAMVQLRFGYGGSTTSLIVWSTAAIAGGAVYGPLGRWWRTGGTGQRGMALGFLGAVWVAEGVYLIGILPEPAIGAGFVVIGSAVPLVVGRSWVDRGRGYAALLPALVLGALGYAAFGAFSGMVSGV